MRKAHPFFAKIVSVVFFINLFLLILFLSIYFNANNIRFYEKQYKKLSLEKTTQLTLPEYKNATQNLLEYMNNKKQHIDATFMFQEEKRPVFNEKEITHMEDVKHLFQTVKKSMIMILITLFSVVMLAYVKYKKSTLKIVNHFKTALLLFISCMSFVFAMIVTQFDLFWEMFHRILFTNELWLLNPQTDRMINMFPLELFQSLVFTILGWFILGMFLIGITVSFIKKKSL